MYNSKKDITIEKVGYTLYYAYNFFKFFIIIINIFVIYKCFNNEPVLLLFCLVLNLLYIILYIRRLWLILLSGIVAYYFLKNIYYSIVLGLATGNTISYILDFIMFKFINIIFRIMEKSSKR